MNILNVELPMRLLDWIDKRKIVWNNLSQNPSIGAIELLKENFDKINWNQLSCNPCAIEFLKENSDKIHWNQL